MCAADPDKLADLKAALAGDTDIELAIVFGSVATGQAQRDSDM